MNNQLIIVKQLPIIEQHLYDLKAEIDQQVKDALSLACTAETRQDVKKARTELRKKLEALEAQRKVVKKAINEPYEAFEAIYKDVTGGLKQADTLLGNKIGAVEAGLIEVKADHVRTYAEELCEDAGIDWLPMTALHLNITLSVTEKHLKEEVKAKVERIAADVEMLSQREDAPEVISEYKKTLDATQAILTVENRRKAIEAEEKRQKEAEEARAREAVGVSKVEEAVEAFTAPVVAPAVPRPDPCDGPAVQKYQEAYAAANQMLKVSFTCIGTRQQLHSLKEYMKKEGIKFE